MSSRLPPTPAMSGEFTIKDQPCDATDVLVLPPAALDAASSRRSSRSDPTYIPASPASPDLVARGRNNHPPKRPLEDLDLPPPPTRTRKIIQMKPKAAPTSSSSSSKSPVNKKENGKVAAAQAPSDAPATNGSTTSKKKQPSTTSAAGRKIARKTAHSLIERRRRSKMNEEFGTLKDMIPACRGQEMHKLAILQVCIAHRVALDPCWLSHMLTTVQASIDYVNYLEQCIQDLKSADKSATPPSPTSPEFAGEANADSMQHTTFYHHSAPSVYSFSASASVSASPELAPPSGQFYDTSPSFSPRTSVPSAPALPDAPSVLPSPALGPTQTSNMDIDHEASAALLMLTRDRRGTADSISDRFSGSTVLSTSSQSQDKMMEDHRSSRGMSVRDLLL
ncbi:hypothetical protein N7474_000427 [Penicillium riverlandense]|uniref:uncharacterized protein n=1 Tax=Penicillium riverlandense TaxID=1903569 RepID=UPI0025482DE4|nr:uncharacterized protein N7474_000427 [Penicillium riverlandense]KAJ5832116.1 hypothetical protein N7474_000427 [Penicillium riverlandense]